ncbi:MAG: hypothetical protein FJY82_11780, partial [Candidatus Aminicenantes bacterium]|nr:hypothetical protein [Candidatus Aminicenantes bacterium]
MDNGTNRTSDLLARFDKLQERLRPLWKQIGRSDPGSRVLEEANTVVVLPSLTVDFELDMPAQQVYEERMPFMLFLLRQPRIRLIYVTSVPIPEEVIDYYLGLLPGVGFGNARRRLALVSPQDGSRRPLVAKILDRPRLIGHIRSLIPDLNTAHLVPFVTTDMERDLAVRLDIPMYAADPRFFAFGTKSGCRRLFSEEGVVHPLGEENLRSKDELVGAVRRMRARKPSLSRLIVKLNEGVSGYGNAQLSLEGLPEPGSAGEVSALEHRMEKLGFASKEITFEWYLGELGKKGGIVEDLIAGEGLVSPSAQLRISPLGEVELLSTHDQMLGGESGQIYLGAVFPADRAYGPLIMREAEKVGRRLAREGVVGRFAIDFIAVKKADGSWEPYAIEINLRKG